MWFLDAHQSGGDTVNNGKNVPLLEELQIILSGMNRDVRNLFVIDDLRLFDNAPDWKHVSCSNILLLFKKHGVTVRKYYPMNDRFVIHS